MKLVKIKVKIVSQIDIFILFNTDVILQQVFNKNLRMN